MTLRDQEGDAEEPVVPESRLLAANAKAQSYKRAMGKLERQIQERDSRIDDLLRINERITEAPTWSRPKKTKRYQATAILMLSDMHFDEVVEPDQLLGPSGRPLNCYNREIAELRLRRTVEGFLLVCEDLFSGFSWDGCVVIWGGDSVSGNIHEELIETNEASPIETVDHFTDPCVSALTTIRDSGLFRKILSVAVPGNHGRNTRKPKAKNRVTDNFDWLLVRGLWRALQGDKQFEWNVPETADAYFELYGYRHLVTHGDQARGGTGISGLATPIALLDHRKRKRDAAALSLERSIYRQYDVPPVYSHMWLGHWHTYTPMSAVTINGSSKGTDEFSFQGNFGHEEPIQAMAVVTPEHNVTVQAPIYSQDRDEEGWGDDVVDVD